eukprot:scaffold576_cov260-Pinguiococcus_pyrenoidosus.AAC.112
MALDSFQSSGGLDQLLLLVPSAVQEGYLVASQKLPCDLRPPPSLPAHVSPRRKLGPERNICASFRGHVARQTPKGPRMPHFRLTTIETERSISNATPAKVAPSACEVLSVGLAVVEHYARLAGAPTRGASSASGWRRSAAEERRPQPLSHREGLRSGAVRGDVFGAGVRKQSGAHELRVSLEQRAGDVSVPHDGRRGEAGQLSGVCESCAVWCASAAPGAADHGAFPRGRPVRSGGHQVHLSADVRRAAALLDPDDHVSGEDDPAVQAVERHSAERLGDGAGSDRGGGKRSGVQLAGLLLHLRERSGHRLAGRVHQEPHAWPARVED